MVDEATSDVSVSTEAIVIVDIVDSTKMSNRFGWYAVGRAVLRDLRSLIAQACQARGLACQKSTGDGYLLTFRNPQSAELATISAVEAIFQILRLTAARNPIVAEEQQLHLRFAVHVGEVDVLLNDREGPHVSYTFRHGAVSQDVVALALNPIPPEEFPLQDYVVCSEAVADILSRRAPTSKTTSIGYFKLKGFTGLHEVFLVLSNQALPC